jgi:hypothetical protein
VARGNQTFQKRQRENKLREKAQLKRERRQQRQGEKKKVLMAGAEPIGVYPILGEAESGAANDQAVESNS